MSRSRPQWTKIHDLGITIYPENKDGNTNEEMFEDFYSPDLDDIDDEYVNENFRDGDKSTDAVLCCAGCFTPICYQCKSVGNSFISKSAVNVFIDCTTSDSSPEPIDFDSENVPVSNKRRIPGNSLKTARCVECNNIIAFLDKFNNYNFKNVIASEP